VTLEGRGVLVVGAASARGRAVALLAGARGAAVASAAEADPGREEDVERAFAAALAGLPRLDVVVHVAPDPPPQRFLETSLSDWNGAVARALRGAFLVSRLAVEEFLAHGQGGRLVHVAPLVRPPAGGQALAAASLHALLALMRSTAKEYGPRRVACNAVVPVAGEPAAPGGAPAEDPVAEAVLFLASAEASYVNGEALRASCRAT
jgi:3-oxoacyl-[acyl-carrier protein] reductase